jgi:hypothetical protein
MGIINNGQQGNVPQPIRSDGLEHWISAREMY